MFLLMHAYVWVSEESVGGRDAIGGVMEAHAWPGF